MLPTPAETGLLTTANANNMMSKNGPTVAGADVTFQIMIIERHTKLAQSGKKHRITSSSVPVMTVVLLSFNVSRAILVSVSCSRRSSISAIKLNHQNATSSWLVPLLVDTQKSRLENVPVVVIRRYRSTAPLTVTRSAVGAEA